MREINKLFHVEQFESYRFGVEKINSILIDDFRFFLKIAIWLFSIGKSNSFGCFTDVLRLVLVCNMAKKLEVFRVDNLCSWNDCFDIK